MADQLPPDPAAGVFETLLVLDGRPVELDAHLRRLERSTAELYGAGLPAEASELVLENAGPLEVGRLRLTLKPFAGGELGAGVVTAPVPRSNVFPSWERALRLRTFAIDGGLGAHKWADRAWLASLESAVGEGSLPLLVDTAGVVLEGSRANVFAVEGEHLLTPPADGRILPGVARSRAIEVARALGIEVREQELMLERLTGASHVFLTGSVRGIEPVSAVEGTTLTGPGDAAREIAAEMERLWTGNGAA